MYNKNSKFKKIIKIFFINAFFIFFLLFVAELYLFTKEFIRGENERNLVIISRNEKYSNSFNFKEYFNRMYGKYSNIYDIQIGINSFREQSVSDNFSDKPAIILLGCSFVYGEGLKDEELFSYLLSKYTHRNIYNLGLGGHSQKSSLYILRDYFDEINEKILKNNKNIDYVIYVYIPDHLRRLYVNVTEQRVPTYNIYKKNNQLHLKLKKPSIINYYTNTHLYRSLMTLKYNFEEKNNLDGLFKLFCLYITEINDEIKAKFKVKDKPTQFVVLVYKENGNENWDILREQGIKVIKINDLLGFDINTPEYKFLDGHPNPKAWEVITPEVIKELNL